MNVKRYESPSAWPDGTIEVSYNGVELYLIPRPDGIEVDTISPFHVSHSYSDEHFEITFFEIKHGET